MNFSNRNSGAAKHSGVNASKDGARKPSKRNKKGQPAGMRLEPLEVRRMLSIAVTSMHDAATDGSLTTLIGAILAADNISGGATINLPANGTYTLSQSGYLAPISGNGSVNTGITLLPGINQPITINGNGSTITLAAGAAGRFFSINSNLTLNNVNLIGGLEQGGAGGGGFTGGGGGAGLGGAVFVNGTAASLTMNQASIASSSATGGAGAYYDTVNSALPGDEGGGGGGGLGGQGADHSGPNDGIKGGGGGGPLNYTATTSSTVGADSVGGTGGTGSGVSGTAGGFGGGGGGGAGGNYVNSNYQTAGAGGTGGFGGGGGGGGYSPGTGSPRGGAGGFGGGGGASGYLTTGAGGAGGAFAGTGGNGANNLQVGGGGAGLGGAIFDYQGTVNLNNVSLVGNSATGGSGYSGGSGAGGALFNYGGGVTLNNATVADNSANAASGSTYAGGTNGSAVGGGIYNYYVAAAPAIPAAASFHGATPRAIGPTTGLVSLFNSALASNTVITQGAYGPNSPVAGDIVNGSGASVVAHGTSHNFIGASSGTISGGTVLTGAAYLDFVGLVGGYIMTPPEAASPLVGAGDPSTSLSVDETGATRSGTTPTIGAYEGALPSPFPLSAGTVVVTESTLGGLFAVDPTTGNRQTLSAAGVLGTGPALINPNAVALDGNGNAYVVTTDAVGGNLDEIIKIDLTTGNRTLLSGGSAGTGTAFLAISAITYNPATGSLLVSDTSAYTIYSVSTTNGNRTVLSDNSTPNGTNLFAGVGAIIYNSTQGIVEADQYFDTISEDSALLKIASNGARTIFSDDTTPNALNPIGVLEGIANNSDGSILAIDSNSNPAGESHPTVLYTVATTGTPGALTQLATLPATATSGDAVNEYGVAANTNGIYVTQTGQLPADNQVLRVSGSTVTELAGNDRAAGPFFGIGLNIGIAIVAATAPNAPTVTTNPASATMNSGGNTTFTSGATGSPTPTEQWQISTDGGVTFNNITSGGIYSGATSPTLTITGGTSALNGDQYRVIFTNTPGSATSTAATLTVDFAPTIVTNPTNQTVNAAGNTSFTAAATGLPAPTVQWQISTNGGSTFTNITNSAVYSGATTNTLNISGAISSMNTDQYRAVYSNTLNGAGSPTTATTTAATLTVNFAPSISTNPSNATINAGGNTSFTSSATGNPTPTEQWQVSTDGGATFTNITNGGIYSGATSPTLTITGGTTALNGDEYQDVFTNTPGSTTTTAATLTVDFAPAITTNPVNQTVNANANTTFTAAATGLPAPTVQWQVNYGMGFFSNINNSGAYSGATTNTLTITGATSGMNNLQYRAVYSNTLNGAGSPSTATTTPATLTVNYAPILGASPTNATIDAGGNASFSSSAGGGPTPTSQWQVSTDGGATFTNLTDGGVYSGSATGTLSITPGTVGMNGYQYRDVFTNGSGTVTSSPSTLAVIVPATAYFSVGSETVNETAGTFSIPVTLAGTSVVNVSTVASGLSFPSAVVFDAAGNMYFTNQSNNTVSKMTPGGAVSTFATGFNAPVSLAFDASGNLFVANNNGGTVMKVTPAGSVSTFASGFTFPSGLAFDASGNLYVTYLGAGGVAKVTPAGAITTFISSGLDTPLRPAFDAAGNLYVANEGNNTVSKVTPAGVVSTFASGFSSPDGLAFDPSGNLYVSNISDNTVSQVTPAGVVSTFASGFSGPEGLAFQGGSLYVANYFGGSVSKASATATVPFTLSGTAASGTDYSGVTVGPLTFAPGQTTQNITGTLLSDPGPNKTLAITLGTPTNASLGSPSVNTLTIQNTITLPVTNMTDSHVDGELSLREALAIVSGANGNYIINVPAGTIQLTQGILSTDDPGYNVAINGVGPGPTVVDAQGASAVMQVTSGTNSNITNFEFTGGSDPNNDGYGGGGIQNAGTLTLNACTVDANSDTMGGEGGGIGNLGTLTVENSAITGNSTDGDGGAIYNDGGTLTVINSTIANNSANGDSAGGIANVDGTCTITDTTVDGNSGGGVFNFSGTLLLQGSIVADSTGNGPDLYGPVSGSYDLIGDGSDTGSGLSNLVSGEPMLTPLGNYGGPTQTMAPLPQSPAIATGSTFADAAGLDQRGIERSLATPTIGAFQSQGFVVTTTNGSGEQSVLVGTPFSDLYIHVTSNDPGVPLTGAVITFTAPLSGASAILGNSSVTLDANGDAQVSASANTTPGSYSVFASAGPAPSTDAEFSLTNIAIVAPTVSTNPTNETINAATNASFTADATGFPTPTQQWQVSTDGGITFVNITDTGVYSGSTTGTLSITGGTAAMNGYEYQDVFTNIGGSATTSPSTLTVDSPPSITLNPISTTVSAGTNVSFTVAATGNPTPTVQWQMSTDGGVTFSDLVNLGRDSGVTTDTLTISGAPLAVNGFEFRAVFTNTLFDAGSPTTATSTAATLTVTAAPAVTVNPTSIIINSGASASFTSSATGNPTPTQHWQISTDGGNVYTNITNGGFYSGATTGTLSISLGIAPMNGFKYRDVFTNGSGSATSSPATLTVDSAPTIRTNPTDQTINTGNDASFSVAAYGNPLPTVQWQVSTDGGATFTNLTDTGIYSGSSTNTLTLTGATLAQTGYEYQAIFSNTLHDAADPSTVTTTPATLTVDIAPLVTVDPASVTINAGSNASFAASATGIPMPTAQWQVSTDGGETFTNITDTGAYSGTTTGTLSITAATPNMNGYEYRSLFTNGAGSVTTEPSTLTVNFVPPTIVNPLMPMTSTSKSVGLKILGNDSISGTDAGMKYLWSLVSAPRGAKAPVFADNGTHTAKRTTVSFSKAGQYNLQCVATDTEGLSVTTTQSITISQIVKSLKLSPHVLVLPHGTQQQYAGVVLDQFGHALRVQPTLTFSVKSGVGSITPAGLFSAGSQIGHVIIEADTTGLSGVVGATVV